MYLPKQSGFSGKNGVGSTERYQRIKSMLQNKLSPPLMTFIVYVTTIYTPFVLLFQREEPLIHILHTQMEKLIADLLRNFLTSSFLSTCMIKNGTEMTMESLRSLDLDKIDKSHVKGKIDMGSKAKSLLNAVDPLQKKKFIESTVIPFYKSCVKYLLEELLLNCQTLIDVKSLHHNMCNRSSAPHAIQRLAKTVLTCLRDAVHDVFDVKKDVTVDQLVDMICAEFRIYQIENIPHSMVYRNEEEKCKKKQQPQKSYWKYAYGIAGIEDNDDNTQEESGFGRIDEFWRSVSKIADETTGLSKFTKLCMFALLCVRTSSWQCRA